ncbi:dihydroxyacetone kinase [Tranquillimonas rosea]|uniref:Dihydroxyacetone kinase n=1 Tax=Tranquillimonas rosea TaxID=641238 RepID=A0A1H9X5A2_9RHOB|nr:dihydroxyacetone kinase subunit DhaL [Tranquillimonas rosea]SES41330.1 dihydroxyacetone kinase [Tranquillimonas rosea]
MTAERTKKLINAPEDLISEAIAGMVSAHPEILTKRGETSRAVVACDGPRDGKVAVVVGGGSGHEPAFAGYVGRGLADAAAVGNVFASPSPEQILDAARAVDGGAGVLFLYGNYTGDVMNFDMAAEELEAAGSPARSVAVTDDVASAPNDRKQERRGIAGDFFVFKIAGAAAEAGRDLDGCLAAARAANAATASMGVALTACSMPQTGKPNFEIGAGEMEIGMGLHGEPGMRRGPLETADAVTDELFAPVADALQLARGDRVAALVNGLGATGLLELYVIQRRLAQLLDENGVSVHRTWVGEYATSLEMAGASVTLLKLDDDLTRLLDAPCRAPALSVGSDIPKAEGTLTRRNRDTRTETQAVDRSALATDGPITPETFRAMVRAAAAAIRDQRDWLSELDGVIGDGDHGVTMDIGWSAVLSALDSATPDETITGTNRRMAKAFLDAVGASSGPLYASAMTAAAAAVSDRLNLDAGATVAWLRGMRDGIISRGGAAPGDKTMLDAWLPAVDHAESALAEGRDALACLAAARDGARSGRDDTAQMESRRGRSKKLGARSVGHVDPGAASTHVILAAMYTAAETGLR